MRRMATETAYQSRQGFFAATGADITFSPRQVTLCIWPLQWLPKNHLSQPQSIHCTLAEQECTWQGKAVQGSLDLKGGGHTAFQRSDRVSNSS